MIVGRDEQKEIIKRLECLEEVNENPYENCLKFLRESAKRHDVYWHYSKESSITNIINNKQLWLTNLKYQNDKIEMKHATVETKQFFAFSLTHGVYENLEAWVLYGDNATGQCLKFNKTTLNAVLKSPVHIIEVSDKYGIISKHPLDADDYKINAYDIVYTHVEGAVLVYDDIMFHLKSNENNTLKIDDSKLFPCCKKGIWSQEHETRIVVELLKPLPNYTISKNSRIMLDLCALQFENISVINGPEYNGKVDGSQVRSQYTDYIDIK